MCPRCGGPMIQRTNRRSGQPFLGCSRYPRCKGTRTQP
ncbi:topoisomerase DNA-binding C4 zinc finger domain-containing protein [Thalassovita sp.]